MLWRETYESQRPMPCGKSTLPSGALAIRADEHANPGRWWHV